MYSINAYMIFQQLRWIILSPKEKTFKKIISEKVFEETGKYTWLSRRTTVFSSLSNCD